MIDKRYFRYFSCGVLFAISSAAFAQFERIDGMTEQGEIMRFCAGFKNRTDSQACLATGQKRLDELYKQRISENERRKRGGPGEECIRSTSDYCKAQKEAEREAREAQIATAAQERKRLAEEQQRKLQAQRATEQERRAALEVCKKSREARLYELADAILMSRMAIEMSEADIEREKSIGKKTGVVNQKALYDAGRLLEDAKNMIKISMPEYQSLGGRERDLKSIASKNPCAA